MKCLYKKLGFLPGQCMFRHLVLAFLVIGNALIVLPQTKNTRAAVSEQLSFSKPLVYKWQYETREIINLTPEIHGDFIFVPLSNGNLISLRLHEGNLVWKSEIGGEITASPLADGRIVFVASGGEQSEGHPTSTASEGAVRALGYMSGVTNWLSKLPQPLVGTLAANEHSVFGYSKEGHVYAIRKADGQLLWTRKNARAFTSAPLVNNDRLFLGSEDGILYAFDVNTGAVIWQYKTGGAISSNVSLSGRTICVGSADYHAYGISLNEGSLLWRYRTGGRVQSVASTARGFLITSLDNFVYLISPLRGKRIWKRLLMGRVAAPPVITLEGALFAPLSGEECVVLELKSGRKLNSVYVGDGNNTAAAPLISGHILLLTTRKGLYALTDRL
jgi:outer membrane protein assembly factor BamB